MKNLILIVFVLGFYINSYAQNQLSKVFNTALGLGERLDELIYDEQEDCYYIYTGANVCNSLYYGVSCLYIAKLNSSLNFEWETTVYEDTLILVSSKDKFIKNATSLYTRYDNQYYYPPNRYALLYQLTTNGSIENTYQIDKGMNIESNRNSELQFVNNHLYFANAVDNNWVHFWKFDEDLALIDSFSINLNPDDISNATRTHILPNENILVSFINWKNQPFDFYLTHKLYNQNGSLLRQSNDSIWYEDTGDSFDALPTIDNGVITVWEKVPNLQDVELFMYHPPFPETLVNGDTVIAYPDMITYAPVLYKQDSLFNLQWEFSFIPPVKKTCWSLEKITDSLYMGLGISNFFQAQGNRIINNNNSGWYNAWVFLIDLNGNLIWEKNIYDYRASRGCYFIDADKTNDGFILSGNLDIKKDTPSPYLNDPMVWLLTLDEQGCFNGECGEYLVIENDTTAYSFDLDWEQVIIDWLPTEELENISQTKVYPNPSNSVLNIEHNNNAFKNISITDINGKSIYQKETYAQKSILNLNGATKGVYILTISDKSGKLISRNKVILK